MEKPVPSSRVDLDAAAQLVAALERDIDRMQHGSGDIDALRAEVRALGDVLKAEAPDPHHVNRGLSSIHAVMQELAEDVRIAADYAARIGRMLGM